MTVLEHIKQLSQSLNDQQRRSLAAFLSSRESTENRQQLRDLYGIWKGAFPGDFDVDAVLHEIRGEWQKEIQEIVP